MKNCAFLLASLCALCLSALGGPPSPAAAPFQSDAARGDTRPPAPRVVLDAPGHVCVEGAGTVARGGEPGASFAIVDWLGRETGHTGAFDTNGCAAIPPLPTGYYRIVGSNCPTTPNVHQSSLSTNVNENPVIPVNPAENDSALSAPPRETALATIAVVPPPERRARPKESFYGADTGPIWHVADPKRGFACPWNGGDALRTLADLVWLSGIAHVRDRPTAPGIMPKPDAFDGGIYLRNARLFAERGVGVCGVFASAPEWTKPRKKMPTDLAAVFSLCARLSREFDGCMDGWEFWNEPEINFAPGPVWDYAAAMKAAYLGFASAPGRDAAPAMPAAHCQDPGSHYAHTLYANDAAKFAPGFNYHCYHSVSQLPLRFARLRGFLRRYGMDARPVWITEVGCSTDGNARDDGPMPQFKAHSPEQELFAAETCPKQMIGLQMEGVSRAYWFIFGAYNERGGRKDWGMMRRDGTVKPAFSALSTLALELGEARIAGEMKLAEGVRAFLFNQPDGSQTLALWTPSAADKEGGFNADRPGAASKVEVRIPHNPAGSPHLFRITDMLGMVSWAEAQDGVLTVSATRHPSYVSGLRGLVPDVQAFPAAAAPHVPEPAPDEDLTVIVRAELNENDFEITRNKTRAVLKGDTGRLRLFVWNLGNMAKTGTVEVAGARLDGLPLEPVALGPCGSRPEVFDCTLVPDDDGGFDRTLEVRGVFNGRRGSRTSIPVWFEKQFMAGCVASPLGCENPERWKRFDSASRLAFSFDEAEKALRMDAEWRDAAAMWSYPSYRLADGETLAGAKAIMFEAKCVQDKVENDFRATRIRIDGFPDAPFLPPNGNWESRYVELPGEGLENVRSFAFGVEPCGRRLTLWLRNVRVLRPAGDSPQTFSQEETP